MKISSDKLTLIFGMAIYFQKINEVEDVDNCILTFLLFHTIQN